MLTAAETARLAKLTSRLERTVTDDLDLDTALALWPWCEDTIMDVCCSDDLELVHDTAMRVRIVCNRITAAHGYQKVGDIIAEKAARLATECGKLQDETMGQLLAA